MFDDKLIKALIVAMFPIMIIGVFGILSEISSIKQCMARMEERLEGVIKYSEIMPSRGK